MIKNLPLRLRRQLQKKLLAWYSAERRDLPWRHTRDPYRIWVSEIMLQQTQTVKVLEYYERYLQKFPDVFALAQAPLDEVLKAWEGLGYYARARNLHRAARFLVAHFRGRLPRDYEKLLTIPGIGPYTAAAVASIAFNHDHAVVDGNVARVLCRWFLIQAPTRSNDVKKLLHDLAQTILPRGQARHWNQAMMELGARICTPRKPRCEICVVQKYCRAFQKLDDPAQLPVRTHRRILPHHHIVVGLVGKSVFSLTAPKKYRGKLLIDQRKNEGLLGGLWEFPGGKIANGESHARALRREIHEQLAIEVDVGEYFMTVEHTYTHFRVTLHVYFCRHRKGEPQARRCQNWRWVAPTELKDFAFPTANRKIIDRLLTEMSG
ncbi:MAG: A/G-specific adenine glycosylase [candidate division KSB1 bacterium]|nr:A/G-specific adenine glycosylase [candidate division KSB1 bacterium]MDZ7301948.1 A/G-specific adenine glycosylase [candidate division KSB1 bacterium]MDZ7312353.1 A/G-specific adenine glycosylase [candidate division KSB1 bacterium]